MKGFLTDNQIAYTLFHIGNHIDLNSEITENLLFQKGEELTPSTPSIIFKLNALEYKKEGVVEKEGIPILFPSFSKDEIYTVEEKMIIFHHDLLKSAFYLLSAYKELDPKYLDKMNRFPFEASIQHELNIAGIPLVNYYFEMIISGIEKYCSINGIAFSRRRHFKNFAFVISHDVDIIDTYSIYEVIYKIKQAMGFAPRMRSRRKSILIAIKYLLNYMNIFSRKNPAWSFPLLMDLEKKSGFTSSYYFLDKEKLHADAYYSFGENRIKSLMMNLTENKCEIGLHGTVKSSISSKSMRRSIESLKAVSPQQISGIRQHRLMYDIKVTPYIHEKANFLYDTSLGFAEHEGFRNSYCHPFKLYDHENDRMMDLWEIPLNAMDVTLFHYRKLDYLQVKDRILELVEEVKKFNGCFSLLWHNNFFDEDLYPGITGFYEDLLAEIHNLYPESLNGREVILKMQE